MLTSAGLERRAGDRNNESQHTCATERAPRGGASLVVARRLSATVPLPAHRLLRVVRKTVQRGLLRAAQHLTDRTFAPKMHIGLKSVEGVAIIHALWYYRDRELKIVNEPGCDGAA